MVAYRELDNAFFQDWSRKHSEAYLSLENREDKISMVCEEIEKDLTVSVRKPGTDWRQDWGRGTSQETEQGL